MGKADGSCWPAGATNRPFVEVLSIIIALSSTREDATAPSAAGMDVVWSRYRSRTLAITGMTRRSGGERL